MVRKLRTEKQVAQRRLERRRAEREAGSFELAEPTALVVDQAKPKFLAVDFFCGAGGTTRGLIDAGGYVMAGVDKEPRCRQTYVDNNPNKTLDGEKPEYLQLDIFNKTDDYPDGQQAELRARLDDLIAAYQAKAPNTPLLFAICAPCQPFTTLARKEMSKERVERRKRDSRLLDEAVVFVERYKPDMVLSENVAGIGDIWTEFEAKLRKAGYATGTQKVCVSKFGVPQYRKRSILIAVHLDRLSDSAIEGLLPEELTVPTADPASTEVTVKEALERFPALSAGETHEVVKNHRTRSLSDLNKLRLSSAKPGESNAYMEKTEHGDLSLDCHKRVNERLSDRCFTDVYTRMSPDRPSPTITTRCHSISNGRFGHYDPAQVRGISLREAAALQSFPDDYVFYPTDMIEPVARMIGNAVPPKLACFFAGNLVSRLKPMEGPTPRPQAASPATGV